MTAQTPSDRFELRHAATDRATIVVVPERRMFAIDGLGDPRARDFTYASERLRTADEAIRARLLHERRIRIQPGVLECAWWTHPEPPSQDLAASFAEREAWHWQQMMEIPAAATDEDVEAALAEVQRRTDADARLLRIIRFEEGRSLQILHVGGPATEHESVRALYEAAEAAGVRPHGHLHEIWLADYQRVPDGRARSILRLPIES